MIFVAGEPMFHEGKTFLQRDVEGLQDRRKQDLQSLFGMVGCDGIMYPRKKFDSVDQQKVLHYIFSSRSREKT